MFLLALAEKVHFYIILEGYKSIQFAVMRNKVCYLLQGVKHYDTPPIY